LKTTVSERSHSCYNFERGVEGKLGNIAVRRNWRRMKQNEANAADQAARSASSAGSETERFRAIVDVRHNEAVTGESGVPKHMRDHELRCQKRSLDEFS
jgi:hypothetical protein